jgi:toxin FitB
VSYLLDTNVVSETRKRRPEPKVLRWLGNSGADAFYISVLTLGEIAKDIQLQHRRDPVAAAAPEQWLVGLGEWFTDRIVAIDREVATLLGEYAGIQGTPADTKDVRQPPAERVAAVIVPHELTWRIEK